MKSKRSIEKRNFRNKEKRLAKKHYRILIGLFIFCLSYHIFIEPVLIGHDSRYSLYVFWLPTIIGIIAIAIYRRKFLIDSFSTSKGFILCTVLFFCYLMMATLYSFLSFGQLAKITWDLCNYNATRSNIEETLVCDVTQFQRGKKSYIYFRFNEHDEKCEVSYATIKSYEDERPSDYHLRINATRGIWNYYTVREYSIEEK